MTADGKSQPSLTDIVIFIMSTVVIVIVRVVVTGMPVLIDDKYRKDVRGYPSLHFSEGRGGSGVYLTVWYQFSEDDPTLSGDRVTHTSRVL